VLRLGFDHARSSRRRVGHLTRRQAVDHNLFLKLQIVGHRLACLDQMVQGDRMLGVLDHKAKWLARDAGLFALRGG
jgi:hypothetical protein